MLYGYPGYNAADLDHLTGRALARGSARDRRTSSTASQGRWRPQDASVLPLLCVAKSILDSDVNYAAIVNSGVSGASVTRGGALDPGLAETHRVLPRQGTCVALTIRAVSKSRCPFGSGFISGRARCIDIGLDPDHATQR